MNKMFSKIHSLYFHNPQSAGFEKLVRYYNKREFRFIALGELYSILEIGKPVMEKMAFVSFDDGWRGNLELIPIIEKYHVPICIFVSTEPLTSGNFWWEYVKKEIGTKRMFEYKKLPYTVFFEQLNGFKQRNPLKRSALTVEELKTICNHPLVTIQSHTVNHPILTKVPDDVLEIELRDSKQQLEKITKKEVYAFSYPNGALSSREVEACKRHYRIAFTVEQNHISVGQDLYLLPRYALTGDFKRDILKVWGIWKHFK